MGCYRDPRVRYLYDKKRTGPKPPPTIRRYDQATRERIVSEFHNLTLYLARETFNRFAFVRQYGELDDIRQLAFEGLLRGIDQHDPLTHSSLEHFLPNRVRNWITSVCQTEANRLKKTEPDFDMLRRECAGRRRGMFFAA
jgi:DNA-directed RNA polymerase specialized sigma subunit